ncbi:flotillin family protein [Myxococcota bacterium]|nr:flotillin family protein [Myxococcota bacterium]
MDIESLLSLFLVGMVVVGGGAIAVMFTIRNLLFISGPNEVLVFSGATDAEGRGYVTVKGGRRVRVPIIERVSRIDLTNMTVDVSVTNAYSKGGIPLTVQGVANLKIAGHQPTLGNALERFLDRPREDIIKIAKDTLEGALRGVLSQLTPEEVNEDKLAFAQKLLEEAEHDLTRLGLALDTLKIQNVSDEVGYLNSIGRKSSAELNRKAKIAEADAKAASMFRDADNRQKARLAECQAAVQISQAEGNRIVQDAQTRRAALVAKEVGAVQALIARAQAEVKVQEARVEQVRRRLEADVIAPAHAEMEAKVAHAKGSAAKIVEDGKATAAVLDQMILTWQQGGDQARDIFLMQKLQALMDSLVGTISDVEINRLTVLPSDNGRAAQSVRLVEELRAGIGVDLPKLLTDFSQSRGAPAPTRQDKPRQ